MYDMLSAILHHDDMGLWPENTKVPDPHAEQRLLALLGQIDPQILTQIRQEVKHIGLNGYRDGLIRGTCFGARLMAQLLKGF